MTTQTTDTRALVEQLAKALRVCSPDACVHTMQNTYDEARKEHHAALTAATEYLKQPQGKAVAWGIKTNGTLTANLFNELDKAEYEIDRLNRNYPDDVRELIALGAIINPQPSEQPQDAASGAAVPFSGADENPPVFGRRWKLADDGFGLQRDDLNGRYVDIDDALSVLHAARPQPIAPAPEIGINGLTYEETSATMSVRGLSEPAKPDPTRRCGDACDTPVYCNSVQRCTAADDTEPAPSTAGETVIGIGATPDETLTLEQRKLNGLLLSVWACANPSDDVTNEQLRNLLAQCVPHLRKLSAQPAQGERAEVDCYITQEAADYAKTYKGKGPIAFVASAKSTARKIIPVFVGERPAALLQSPADTKGAGAVGELTDEQIRAAYETVYPNRGVMGHGSFSFARAILAAAKAQPELVPLTIDRLREIERNQVYNNTTTLIDFARAIEAAHGITKKGQQ